MSERDRAEDSQREKQIIRRFGKNCHLSCRVIIRAKREVVWHRETNKDVALLEEKDGP